MDIITAVRKFGGIISQTRNLEEFVLAAIDSVAEIIQTQSSCMILLNSTFKLQDAVEMLIRYPDHDLDHSTQALSLFSPIYKALAVEQRAILFETIQQHPAFQTISETEHQFLHQLEMAAFAPIVLENTVIGILACGARHDGSTFDSHHMELLSILAIQTGTGIRNARIMDDLHHLNHSMQSLNKSLKTSNEQLNQMDSIKTDFITIASHELRTPLAQVRGYTDIMGSLNDQGMLNLSQTNNFIGKLSKAIDRMEELITAMLDVSQLDVDAMALHLTETSIESVTKMAIEPLSEAIIQRKIRLTAHGLRDIPTIQADLQRLVQAFRNIIVNAVKFTPDGGRIEIRATMERNEQDTKSTWVLLSIQDKGIGIDSQNLELIFQKFFRASDPMLHSSGNTKFLGAGPGLGLTIVRGIIEGHGGTVWAESPGYNPDSYPGTTFWIRLPVNTPDTARRIVTVESSETAPIHRTDEFQALMTEQDDASPN